MISKNAQNCYVFYFIQWLSIYSFWAVGPFSGVVSLLVLLVETPIISRACDLFHGCSSPEPNSVYTMISMTYNPMVTKKTICHALIVGCDNENEKKNNTTL